MADELDLAAEREEIARMSAMVTSKKPEGPKATGHCLYCGDKLPDPMRWCDADCISGFNALQAYRYREGKR